MRELEVQRRRGELIEVDTVRRIVSTAAQAYRTALENWPARVAAVLAANWGVDGGMVCRDLEAAIREQLVTLADWTAGTSFE